MSISTIGRRHGVNGSTLRRQYKEVISGYRSWEQLSHADEYVLFPQNIGQDMSLDETCLSNGMVYTILTNKAAKGGKGALAAMIKGVSSDFICSVLRKMPADVRRKVKTLTTDLSPAMMLVVRTAFPCAMLVNDRFHVQQLLSEALDQLRVRFRWEVLDEENKALREYRERRRQCRRNHTSMEPWSPAIQANGETMPQVMVRSRHLLFKHHTKWNEQQKDRSKVLFKAYPLLEKGYWLSMKLTDIFNRNIRPAVARLLLAKWFNEVEALGIREFERVRDTFTNHYDTIINYFDRRLTNASAESFNAKIKAFRTQFRGVGDVKFFMFRLATQFA